MSARKFKGFSARAYKTASYILLGIVIIETIFLVRICFKGQFAPKAARRQAVAVGKKKITKIPVAKMTAPAPAPSRPPAGIPTPKHSKGKIAIIVDDSGYNPRDCEYLRSISSPVTISILPNLRQSKKIAQCAHAYQKEVMLHLPLEAHENEDVYPKNYVINIDMPKGLIIDRLEEALESVPYADGINNHMGSKATEDQRLMSIIFAQLLNKNLFFVDSRVTSKTVCPGLARKTGLPFAIRDVFIDNINKRPAIEAQFHELARLAAENGFAIGIAHTRPLSWKIIQEQTEELKQEGFEIVPVKTIVNKNRNGE